MDAKVNQGAVEEQLHHLDESLALSRVGGDSELLREVVELFLSDYPHTLDKIREAVAAHDRTGLEHHAHSLKGSVSTFGAQEAFEAAMALEQKGRSGDLTNAEAGLSQLECALTALRPELEAIQAR
jgi:two-component system sensor histidine kinase/response regulator